MVVLLASMFEYYYIKTDTWKLYILINPAVVLRSIV